VELELPSGMKILARRPDPLQLAAWERLPLALAAVASGEQTPGEITAGQVAETAGFLRDLLVYCCVEPRVSLNPAGEDEIHPREIPQRDWTFILHWALRVEEARALEGFRPQRADAGGGGDGERVLDKTF
jgi:hypothetical protein